MGVEAVGLWGGKIIGLCGYAGSGKTEVAKILHLVAGYTRIRFAKPLKDMLRTLGLSEDEIEGHLKEVPCDFLGGKTPRWAMQSLGTEWGRDMIHEDLWVNAWAKAAMRVPKVVCEDVRFENEEKAIRDLGGQIWRIKRGAIVPLNHPSEAYVGLIKADAEILNDGSIDDLYAIVKKLLEPSG